MSEESLIEKFHKIKNLIKKGKEGKAYQIAKSIDIKELETASLESVYEIFMIVADVLFGGDDYDRAIKFYEKVLNLPIENKDFETCYTNLGISYCQKEEYGPAAEYLGKALDYVSNNADREVIYEWLAIVYKDSGDFSRSIEFSEKLLGLLREKRQTDREAINDIADVFVQMSVCYWQLKDHAKSEECFAKAIGSEKIRPKLKGLAYSIKAHLLYENKQWEAALEHYREAIRLTDIKENKKDWKWFANLCEKELNKK